MMKLPDTSPSFRKRERQRDWERTQPVLRRVSPRRRSGCLGCFPVLVILVAILAGYFFAPFQTKILILGVDYAKGDSMVSRSDTIILTTIKPLGPDVGMLSVPRDLWVNLPGIGENRINTAHFFAEANLTGSGPAAVNETIQANFGVSMDYYIRIRFQGFREIVDAMGGVDITLEEARAGYEPGTYHLTGRKALAFARHRMGTDDFFRMENGQFLVKAILQQLSRPSMWWRIPWVLVAALRNIDTDIPSWLMPRLGLAILRVGASGIDARTITRDMATSFFTADGANVLQPDWNQILLLIREMFGP